MKQFNLDPNYFTQIGLDSGSLTMLGTIVHSFNEAGEYRGTVRREKQAEGSFYVSADKNSAVAQVNIDLAAIADARQKPDEKSDCCKDEGKNRFVVNPKGYALFHVSGGAGGFNVHLRRAQEDPKTKVFDSSQLEEGDIFSAIIVRPGTYSLKNLLAKAEGQITVSYPVIGKTAYRPPPPVSVQCDNKGFSPKEIHLQPGQGLNFHIKSPSRIKIELVRPDDGPGRERPAAKRGWRRVSLPKS